MTQKISDNSTRILPPTIVKHKPDSLPTAESFTIFDFSDITTSKKKSTEICVVFLGTAHKEKLFEKLVAAAERSERHLKYKDTYYLDYTVAGIKYSIELTDPGLAHTGAREMAIRKADALILYYAAYDAESFHRLGSLSRDFECRKDSHFPPVLLICDEDPNAVAQNTASNSNSKGYDSASELNFLPTIVDNKSTTSSSSLQLQCDSNKRIERFNDNLLPIKAEQGRDLAKLFGPYCEFHSIFVENYRDAPQLVEDLLKKMRNPNPTRRMAHPRKFIVHSNIRAVISSRLRRKRGSVVKVRLVTSETSKTQDNSPHSSANLDVNQTELGSSSTGSTEFGYLSLSRFNPFTGYFQRFRDVSTIFRQRESETPSPSVKVKNDITANKAFSQKSSDEINADMCASTSIYANEGITEIKIYDDEKVLPHVYRTVHKAPSHYVLSSARIMHEKHAMRHVWERREPMSNPIQSKKSPIVPLNVLTVDIPTAATNVLTSPQNHHIYQKRIRRVAPAPTLTIIANSDTADAVPSNTFAVQSTTSSNGGTTRNDKPASAVCLIS